VTDYAFSRLYKLEAPEREQLSQRIGEAAEGIFLYAHLLLDDLLPTINQDTDIEELTLPAKLTGLYHEFLNREFGGPKRDFWFSDCKTLLGLTGVSQGVGLLRKRYQNIAKQDPSQALESTKQYLDGELPEGPFRLFHKSFSDFLLHDRQANTGFQVDPSEHHELIADYYMRDGDRPWRHWDDYGFYFAITHKAESLANLDPFERYTETERLVSLACSREFQEQHQKQTGDPVALEQDLRRTLRVVAESTDSESLPVLIQTAMGLVEFKREQLRPDPLFELARNGDLTQAEAQLPLFGLDAKWHQAARLILIWIAADHHSEEAKALYDQLADEMQEDPILLTLQDRVHHSLGGSAPYLEQLDSSNATLDVARDIVIGMGGDGEGFSHSSELLHGYDRGLANERLTAMFEGMEDDRPTYLAERDGPLLVACALQYPVEGDEYLSQYIDIHAANGYLYYRNLSLWILFDAVMRHPDDEWAREKCCKLLTAVLGAEPQTYEGGLRYTLLALRANAGENLALDVLATLCSEAIAEAERLLGDPNESDPWAAHKRTLADLAQAFSILPDSQAKVAELLQYALRVGKGFAGFQAPSWLTVAESVYICDKKNKVDIERCLQLALEAAHNVQEPVFCAQNTARVNTITKHWKQLLSDDKPIMDNDDDLDISQANEQFTSFHVIGEQYPKRHTGPDKVELPWVMRNATTLAHLAQVYRQSLSDIMNANREQGWLPDEELPIRTEVKIPDKEFAPIWAAAKAAKYTGYIKAERKSALGQLVPDAVDNPVVHDTVLSRLLLAYLPTDSLLLNTINEHVKHLVHLPPPQSDLRNGYDQSGVMIGREVAVMGNQFNIAGDFGHIEGGRIVGEWGDDFTDSISAENRSLIQRMWFRIRNRLNMIQR